MGRDYQAATVYFASGTGNSFRTAVWLADAARARGAEARVVPIDAAGAADELLASPEQLVGVSFPTHGLLPPWSMIKFLLRMRRRRGAHALVIATRGCAKLGPLYVPGVAGLATFLAGILLLAKGYRPLGGIGLDMPSNVLNIHWGLHPRNVKAIIERARRKLDRYTERVFAGRGGWVTLNSLWELAWGGALLALYPLFFPMYLIIGKLFMAKLFFAGDRCNGCGLCARTCPNQAIKMVGAEPRPFWTYACEACIRCMGYCKRRAVQVSQPWLVLVVYGMTFATAAGLQRLVAAATGFVLPIPAGIVADLVGVALAYPLLILVYYLFWLLTRPRWLNRFFSYATPTRYYRRYREPATPIGKLASKAPPAEERAADRG